MKRAVVALVAVASLSACTPEVEQLVAWVQQQQADAEAAGLPCPELADAIAWRGLPVHFHYVIERESRCQPNAVNDTSGALGLTQVLPFWLRDLCPAGIACTEAELLDPLRNLDAARYIFDVQGPDAWVTW